MANGMENYSVKFCSKYTHDDFIYKKEKYRRGVDGPWGGTVMRRMFRSVATVAKITLICLNIWVLAVVLVVSLGHWRVFETENSSAMYDNSHLVVMRELKEDADRKLPIMAMSVTNISEVESYFVPPGEDSLLFMASPDKAGQQQDAAAAKSSKDTNVGKAAVPAPPRGKDASPPVANPEPPAPHKQKPPGQSRLDNLQNWCRQQHHAKPDYNKIPASWLTNIFVDNHHKLLFCQIPGVAQNEWRKILLITTKSVNVTSPAAISGTDVFGKYGKSLTRLSDLQDSGKRAELLTKYQKVLFVRDPLERLLMAYNTKFKAQYSKYFHNTFGTHIIKKYRKGATPDEIKAGSSVRFSEFAKYVVDSEFEGKIAHNEHWQQYYKLCHPCVIDYNFVGTFENVEADTRSVLQKVKADKKVKPPLIGNRQVYSEKQLMSAYKHVDVTILKRLYKAYQSDYTLFGYKCPNFLHALLQKADDFHDY